MKETVTLSNGTEVECQAVSVFLAIDIADELGIVEPDKPEKSLGGVVKSGEKIPFTEDDNAPEWLAYKAALAEYEAENKRFSRSFHWNIGVIRWKLAGSRKFTSTPPKDWTVPSAIGQIKLLSEALDPRRTAYIKYELLANTADANAVAQVIYGGALLSSTEVDDAVKSFPN